MTSLIDTQPATIQQLSVPICDGATTGSPSLIPYAGSLCYDYTTPGVLYTGNGVVWKNIGLSNIDELEINNLLLTTEIPGNPALTINMAFQRVTSGNVSMVSFQITIPLETRVLPANAFWYKSNFIPIGFIPSADIMLSMRCFNSQTGTTIPAFLYLSQYGLMTIDVRTTESTDALLYSVTGVYLA